MADVDAEKPDKKAEDKGVPGSADVDAKAAGAEQPSKVRNVTGKLCFGIFSAVSGTGLVFGFNTGVLNNPSVSITFLHLGVC